MVAILRHALARMRGSILGWGLSLFVLGLFLMPLYDTVVSQQTELLQMIQAYPKELTALFGDLANFATPEGFIGVEFFSYLPLVLGIFSILAGSGMLVAEEEAGTLDLVLAHPIKRISLFVGQFLALLLATLAILAMGWIGVVAPSGTSELLDVSPGALILPFLTLLAQLLLFSSLSLLLSMLLPSRMAASMVSGLLLVASFFLTGFARLNANLEPYARFSPLNYYQSGEAINGLNLTWFASLLGFSLIFTLLACWRFQRRDIRVSGEGGWPWVDRLFRRRKGATRI